MGFEAGLIAMRMRLSGGKQVAGEAEVADAAIEKTAATTEAASKRAVRAGGGIRRSLTSQIASMRSIGRGLTKFVTVPILGVAAISGKFALDFDRNMRNVNSIAQLPERQFKRLKQSVLDLAGPTAQAPNTLAEGLYDLVSSGFDARESLVILKRSALAASAGLTTTEVATKAVAAALNAYELPAKKAGQVSDQLFETVNRGALSFEQLATTIGDVLPFASQMGVGLDQVGASISTMTIGGLSAAEASTRLKNTLVTMLKPGKDLASLLKDMGTTGEDLVRKKGLQGALEAILAQTDGSKEAVAALFPNIRALGGVLALTGIHAGKAAEDLAAFKDTAGVTAQVLAEQEKSFGFQMQRAWADLQAVLIEIGEQVLPIVIPPFLSLLRTVRDTLHTFSALPGPVKAAAGELAVLAALAGPMLLFASAVLTAAKNLGILQATEAGTTLNKGKLGRLGAGVAGIGAIAAGQAIGGKGGELISNIGGGAGLGFAVAGPMGAAVGATGGAIKTALPEWEALLGLQKKMGPLQGRVAASGNELTAQLHRQRTAGAGLIAATHRLMAAQHNHALSTDGVKAAQRHLNAVISEYGSHSRPAIHAEAKLTETINEHRTAIKRLHNAERLRGAALSAYKTETNTTILAERHRINTLKALRERQTELFLAAKQANPTSAKTHELASALLKTEGHLAEAVKAHSRTVQEASAKAGAKYAQFVSRASQDSLRFGGAMKANKLKVEAFSRAMEHLIELEQQRAEAPAPASPFGHPAFPGNRSRHRGTSTPAHPQEATRARASTSQQQPQHSTALNRLLTGEGRTRTVTRQPVQFTVNKRVLAEGVVEVQDDEDART